MEKQGEIMIYVRGCTVARMLDWAASRLGELSTPEVVGDATVYGSPCGPLIVTAGIEDGPFVSLWFNTPHTPWQTDVDCGRDAARELGCTVRCDPGQHFPGVSPHSPVFLEVVGDRETLVTWG